jgi:predicted nuclease of predicted toxin-antitoxin system
MKIKLDENLPARLAHALSELGHNADTVPQEGLAGMEDARIWQATQAANRFLITQDMDFSDLRQFAPGTHAGILLVRLAAPGREALVHYVTEAFRSEDVAKWPGCFIVLTERKLRIVTPK